MEDRGSKTEEGGTGADTLRLFVAISLPESVEDEIEKAQRKLRDAFPGKLVRWTKREQFHLTLKFLGNVRESRVSGLISALREACMPLPELQLRAEGIGFFPGARSPRVVWVGVRDRKNLLLRLHKAVEAGVRGVTGERPDKEFTGHVTLGRIERIRRQDAEMLAELVAEMSKLSFGEWTADKIELIRSELSSTGSRYTTLASIPLCGKRMSKTSDKRSEEFLKISDQFKLGALVTESSHPVTADLSAVAKEEIWKHLPVNEVFAKYREFAGSGRAEQMKEMSKELSDALERARASAKGGIAKALDLLFQVDNDVVAKYQEFAKSGRAEQIKDTVLKAARNGGKLFFTGCGSTGRLSILLVSIWRDFWQQYRNGVPVNPEATSPRPSPPVRGGEGEDGAHGVTRPTAEDFENRAFSVMAGGDFALIKSVEGFEDFAAFGKKQIGDLGVSNKDVVFAITEGGETSFVIGTAWKGVEVGAKVYFVYNNPDDVLCKHVERSREVIEDSRIEKINLTTGPMAITGSTRMQATTIQLCVLVTVMEMVVRELVGNGDAAAVPVEFLPKLTEMLATLRSPEVLSQLARIVEMEELVYRSGHKNTYYADRFGIDVLADTTERSPTYCTPPFRKFDDATATESWAFLFLPCATTELAWNDILKRKPNCVEWGPDDVRELVGKEKFERTLETVRKISRQELMRFKIGLDGWSYRGIRGDDSSVAILSENEEHVVTTKFLSTTYVPSVHSAYIYFGRKETFAEFQKMAAGWNADTIPLLVPCPATDFLLDGVTRAGVKMLLNALSTCTMVRLGRVMGNYMIWVVASNLKLIDRATRYIQKLTGLAYEDSNRLLFEVIEYVEPRMKSDQAYPPVVGLAVLRARDKLSNEEAERRFNHENNRGPQGR